jgi:hypothetical protein
VRLLQKHSKKGRFLRVTIRDSVTWNFCWKFGIEIRRIWWKMMENDGKWWKMMEHVEFKHENG